MFARAHVSTLIVQVALAGPSSLHVITQVAASLIGQLRMMAGACARVDHLCVRLCVGARARMNVCVVVECFSAFFCFVSVQLFKTLACTRCNA